MRRRSSAVHWRYIGHKCWGQEELGICIHFRQLVDYKSAHIHQKSRWMNLSWSFAVGKLDVSWSSGSLGRRMFVYLLPSCWPAKPTRSINLYLYLYLFFILICICICTAVFVLVTELLAVKVNFSKSVPGFQAFASLFWLKISSLQMVLYLAILSRGGEIYY